MLTFRVLGFGDDEIDRILDYFYSAKKPTTMIN
jgi:hypothetical protein